MLLDRDQGRGASSSTSKSSAAPIADAATVAGPSPFSGRRPILFANAAAGTPCCNATLIATAASPSSASIAEPGFPEFEKHLGRSPQSIKANGGRYRHPGDGELPGDRRPLIRQASPVRYLAIHRLPPGCSPCARARGGRTSALPSFPFCQQSQAGQPDIHRTKPDIVRSVRPGQTRTSSLKDVRCPGHLSGRGSGRLCRLVRRFDRVLALEGSEGR